MADDHQVFNYDYDSVGDPKTELEKLNKNVRWIVKALAKKGYSPFKISLDFTSEAMSLLKFIDNELKRMDEDDRTLPEDYHLYDSDGYSPELQHELAEERGKRQFGGESHEDELYRAKFRGDVDDIEYEVVESNKRGKYMDLSNTVDYLSAIHSERGFLDAEQVAKAERGKTKPIKAKVPTDGRDVEDIKAEGQGIPPSSLGK